MTEQRLKDSGRTQRRRAPIAVGAAVLVLAVTAGCSENPEPEPLDRASSSTSSTPTPTTEPTGAPTLPPEAKGTSKKAAIAFVEHVIEVLNYTAGTLNARSLLRLSTSDCSQCLVISKGMTGIRDAGGRISGGAWDPVETNVLAGCTSALCQIQAVVDYAPQKVVRRAGSDTIHHPGGRTVYVFDLRSVAGQWMLSAIRGVQS